MLLPRLKGESSSLRTTAAQDDELLALPAVDGTRINNTAKLIHLEHVLSLRPRQLGRPDRDNGDGMALSSLGIVCLRLGIYYAIVR
jgi:hypothetical protein